MPYSINPNQRMLMQQMFGGQANGMPPMMQPDQGGGAPGMGMGPSFVQNEQPMPQGVGEDWMPPPTGDDQMIWNPPDQGDPMPKMPMPPPSMSNIPNDLASGGLGAGMATAAGGGQQQPSEIAQKLTQVPPEARQKLVQALMQRFGGMF